jgi:rubrerythrin
MIHLVDSSFACLAMLEDETCQLYEIMVSKTNDIQVKLLLDNILQESRTHRELLKHIDSFLGHDCNPSRAECEKQMGRLFAKALAFVRSAKDEASQGKAISEIARKLLDFEQSASEEYLTEMHAGIRALIEINPAVKRILEGIAHDEKTHVEILQLILQMAPKE